MTDKERIKELMHTVEYFREEHEQQRIKIEGLFKLTKSLKESLRAYKKEITQLKEAKE